MPRPSKNVPTSSLNLEMAVETRKQMEQVRDETRADSLGEVVRRALSLYKFLLAEQKTGHKIISRGLEGEKEIVILE